jgi:hypothetical protein
MQPKTMQTDRQMLREYLLGALPEDLASDLDARLFSEDELHGQLQEEQNALIEDFVYGRLAPDEEAAFQSQCARSPLLQRKVESFRNFLSALESQSNQAPLWKVPYFSLPRFLAPALALMLCVASLLYLKELRRNAVLISQLQASSRAPGPLTPALDGKAVSVVAFLSANVPRGPATTPQIIVPAGARILELQVELHPMATGEVDRERVEWDMELLRGDEVLSKAAHVRLRRIGHQTFLPLIIDIGTIHAGSYIVRYSPHSDPGAIQIRQFYVAN